MDEPRPASGEGESAEAVAGTIREGGEGMSRRRLLGRRGRAAGATLGGRRGARASSAPRARAAPLDRRHGGAGTPLVDEQGRPVQRDELETGSVPHRVPGGRRPARAGLAAGVCASIRRCCTRRRIAGAGRRTGILAFSKICTHAGCAVAMLRYPLYEPTEPGPGARLPLPLLDVRRRRGADVVFGPAGRPLPQLPLRLAADGDARGRRADVGPCRPGLVGGERALIDRHSTALDERTGAAPLLARRCATRFLRTGRSCSARSPSTRSSCWWSRGST